MEPADAFITLAESDPYPEGAGKSDSSSSPASPGSSQELLVARRSRPPGRKGHFKSRNGCLNCKRRRVKCNEEHPECYSCRRLGLLCEYAAVRGLGGAAGSDAPPRPVLSTLTFEDLHFYHQFLTIAFPTLPLGGFQIWQQCAAMSHQYNHLGHAVLALGAAHVAQNGDPSSTAQALKHRVAAMKLVNEQLAQPARSQADGDALLGSIMILSAQSALLPDAMIEYMTLTRGGNLVATSIMPDFTKSLFRSFSPEGHAASLTKLIRDQPGDQEQLCAFRSSLLLLEPFCRAQSEVDYVRALKIIPVILEVSSREAWLQFAAVFMMPTKLSNDEWLAFSHPDNHVGHLLLLHLFLLDYVLGSFMIEPSLAPQTPGRKKVVVSWVDKVASQLPPRLAHCAQWPISYCRVLSSADARHLFSP